MNADIRVIVAPGGKLQIFVDGEVNDEQATALTKAVLATLQAGGVTLDAIGDVEFHRNGGTHAHVIQRPRQTL